MIMPAGMPELRWRDDGVEGGAWSTLFPAPAENLGFIEGRNYAFEKPPTGGSFFIDDEPLQGNPDGSCWRWEPGFFAGEVTAALIALDGSTSALFLLDVAPDPTKLGRDVFRQMIDELWNEDPELVVGSEPATTLIGELGATHNPWLEFARLRRYAPEFLRALAPIRAKPRRALQVRRDSAPLHHARRVDRRTAMSIARSPAVALFLPEPDEALPLPGDTRLDVPVVEETLDAAVNRAMLALIHAFLRRTRSLRDRLQELVDREASSETRTSLGSRWPARKQVLDDFAARLLVELRQSPFASVRRAEITAAGLTAIASDPIYARAWGRGWRALRHGLDSTDSNERLWISPSWEIYERWCFLRLGKLLCATAPQWEWRRVKGPQRWLGSFSGRHAELRLQPTFRSRAEESDKMWSVSRERVPDLVFTIESSDGVRFVVLDAKDRTSRLNVLDAMASAHIYQDSLRIGSRRPEASLLLIPSGGGAPWLEDPAFQADNRVGVHVLSADDAGALPAHLKQGLDDFAL